MIYNNFRGGGGAFEIRKTPKVYGGSQVPKCLSQAKLTPHCKNRNVFFYGTNIFIFMQTFLWNKYLFKNIYVYIHVYLPS